MYENIEAIDEIISNNAVGWSIKRITKTALAILRLAIYEIKYVDDVPEKVAINEAVELAKRFGEDGAGAFVNGVLAGVVKAEG